MNPKGLNGTRYQVRNRHFGCGVNHRDNGDFVLGILMEVTL